MFEDLFSRGLGWRLGEDPQLVVIANIHGMSTPPMTNLTMNTNSGRNVHYSLSPACERTAHHHSTARGNVMYRASLRSFCLQQLGNDTETLCQVSDGCYNFVIKLNTQGNERTPTSEQWVASGWESRGEEGDIGLVLRFLWCLEVYVLRWVVSQWVFIFFF